MPALIQGHLPSASWLLFSWRKTLPQDMLVCTHLRDHGFKASSNCIVRPCLKLVKKGFPSYLFACHSACLKKEMQEPPHPHSGSRSLSAPSRGVGLLLTLLWTMSSCSALRGDACLRQEDPSSGLARSTLGVPGQSGLYREILSQNKIIKEK